MPVTYEHRTVAFVDILGFADHVRRSAEDPAFLIRLHQALTIVDLQGQAWAAQSARAGAGQRPEDTDFRSQVFSDSIVLSSRGKMAVPLFISVSQLAMALLDLGVLLRGGIADGELYHDDRMVFGPVLVAAYLLESRAARWPRVLVTDSVVDISRENVVKFVDRGPEGGYVASEFLRRDADRLYHVDPLATAFSSPATIIRADEAALRERLTRAGQLALAEFSNVDRSTDVRSKWGWFLDYFNDFAQVMGSRFPGPKIERLETDDDEMDPVATREQLRVEYYRRRGDGD